MHFERKPSAGRALFARACSGNGGDCGAAPRPSVVRGAMANPCDVEVILRDATTARDLVVALVDLRYAIEHKEVTVSKLEVIAAAQAWRSANQDEWTEQVGLKYGAVIRAFGGADHVIQVKGDPQADQVIHMKGVVAACAGHVRQRRLDHRIQIRDPLALIKLCVLG